MGPDEINLNFATEALKDYIGTSLYITNNITKIQKAVADYYKITIDDLLYNRLPESYGTEDYQLRLDLVYRHVYDSYFGENKSVYISSESVR